MKRTYYIAYNKTKQTKTKANLKYILPIMKTTLNTQLEKIKNKIMEKCTMLYISKENRSGSIKIKVDFKAKE